MKNRMIFAVALSFVLIMGFALGKPMAQSISKKGEMSALIGVTVEDSQGSYLGEIIDVAPGPKGRAAFAVLRYWISDDTQSRVAVPLNIFSCEARNCIVQASRETLESAPPLFSEDGLAQPGTAENIFRYFGVQPYWTEEE